MKDGRRGYTMGGIIHLSDKIAHARSQRYQQKIEAARRIFLCSGCPSKCTKCGTQLDASYHVCSGDNEQVFRFCSACDEEYTEYRLRKEGKSTAGMYWQNDQWMSLWDAWIHYQTAVNEYRSSKEFLQLVEDLNG
jgi:hypothetical protein